MEHVKGLQKQIKHTEEIENNILEVFPINDIVDHFEEAGDCPCNPVVAFDGFDAIRFHSILGKEQEINECTYRLEDVN